MALLSAGGPAIAAGKVEQKKIPRLTQAIYLLTNF
jgi:hypothetical protein